MKIAIKTNTGKFLTERLYSTKEEAEKVVKNNIKIWRKASKKLNCILPRLTSWKNAQYCEVSFSIPMDYDIVFYSQATSKTPVNRNKVVNNIDNNAIRSWVDKRLSKTR